MGFIHLHTHSAYSLSEGAIKVEKLPALALAANMPAVAMTDTANLFGALEFAQAAAGKGIQPIMGCQLWLSRGEEHSDPNRNGADVVTALAMDAEGWSNLQRLSSLGWLGADISGKPAITAHMRAMASVLSQASGRSWNSARIWSAGLNQWCGVTRRRCASVITRPSAMQSSASCASCIRASAK